MISLVPAIPVSVPCMICKTLGQPDDPRYAAHIIRSGQEGVILMLWCPECGERVLQGLQCTMISRQHALELFQHYAKRVNL